MHIENIAASYFPNLDVSTGSWPCVHHHYQYRYQYPAHGHFCDYHSQLEDEDYAVAIQKEIYLAKQQAKTVSVINGCLYIDYQYVGPLPPGCDV